MLLATGRATIAALPGRTLDLSAAVVVLVVLQTTTVLTILALVGRYGVPRSWPPPLWCAAVLLAGLAAVVVLWINDPLEGSTIVSVTTNHGVAVGDLLAVPFLAAAIALMVLRRRRGKR
jgi:hypothetical protein